MATGLSSRPFGNFRQAITDLSHYFGRDELLAKVERSPAQVYILLGGRRIGKTSTLYALKERLLQPLGSQAHVLPVLIDLRREQPASLEHLLERLLLRLQEAIVQYDLIFIATKMDVVVDTPEYGFGPISHEIIRQSKTRLDFDGSTVGPCLVKSLVVVPY